VPVVLVVLVGAGGGWWSWWVLMVYHPGLAARKVKSLSSQLADITTSAYVSQVGAPH
jgi:hypothetical protein